MRRRINSNRRVRRQPLRQTWTPEQVQAKREWVFESLASGRITAATAKTMSDTLRSIERLLKLEADYEAMVLAYAQRGVRLPGLRPKRTRRK
jgi:hypothetical protein